MIRARLCDRCGADRRFSARTEELRRWFAADLDAIEAEAEGLARELDHVAFWHGVKVER